MDISEDVGRLLVHCKETGGFMVGDPVVIPQDAIDEAEGLGLVDVEWDGTAVLTPTGLAWAAWSRFTPHVDDETQQPRSPRADLREQRAQQARRTRRRRR